MEEGTSAGATRYRHVDGLPGGKAHWEGLIAADFFTTEVLGRNGPVTFYTLFVIEVRSRFVSVCGTTV